MNGDDAIVLLTDGATVLALHAGCFRPFFEETCFVNDSDRMSSPMFFGDDFLEFVSHGSVIPVLFCKEPLDGSDGHPGLKSNGFAVFSGKVGNQSGGIEPKIISCVLVRGAGFEASQQSVQIGANLAGTRRVHYGILRESKSSNENMLQYFNHAGQEQFIAL